ncbi:MAG: hypothetical protein R3F50_20225 [Gammaproteobacteria bacterium]
MSFRQSKAVVRRFCAGFIGAAWVVLGASRLASAAENTTVVDDSLAPWDWLLERRAQVSRQVTQLGRSLDEWLAGEGVGQQLNETYLSIRFNQLYGTFDHYNSKVKIGGRLDLPAVSERWKLVFDSDVQELNSLEENVLDGANSGDTVGALRYQNDTDSGWNLSHDVGIRSLAPVDPYYRFRARYALPLNEKWQAGLDQKIWYYDSRGWGYETELSFIRRLEADRFIRIASEGNFQDSRNRTDLIQTVALFRTLGDQETLGYQLGILGTNKPNVRVNDYFAQLIYRRAIYEDWLLLEFTPQILVSRVESWRPQPRLLLNLEMLFFDF